jgi:hypothetical protein
MCEQEFVYAHIYTNSVIMLSTSIETNILENASVVCPCYENGTQKFFISYSVFPADASVCKASVEPNFKTCI